MPKKLGLKNNHTNKNKKKKKINSFWFLINCFFGLFIEDRIGNVTIKCINIIWNFICEDNFQCQYKIIITDYSQNFYF